MKIDIELQKLEAGISEMIQFMETFDQNRSRNYFVESKGNYAEAVKESLDFCMDLERAFYFLMDCSKKVLIESKSGYLNMDETLSQILQGVKE